MSEVNYISLFTLCAMCAAGTAAASPILVTGPGATSLLSSPRSEFAAAVGGLQPTGPGKSPDVDWFRYFAHDEPQGSALDSSVLSGNPVGEGSGTESFAGVRDRTAVPINGLGDQEPAASEALRTALSSRTEDAGATGYARVLMTGFSRAALLGSPNGFGDHSDDALAPLAKSRGARSPRGLFDAPEEVASVQSATIPEPATLLLLGTGLFGAGFGARHLTNRASARERRRREAPRNQTPLH